MIVEEWRKFRGWKVLEFFLREGGEIHVQGLAKKIGVSPQTANYYLKFYKEAGVLEERRKANLLLYSLADNALTRQLKVFYIVDVIYPFILKFAKENSVISVLLYGSHASGTYDKSSDIDLLVVSQRKQLKLDRLKELENVTGKEVKIQVFTVGEWRNLKRRKDAFVQSVTGNSILLFGAEL